MQLVCLDTHILIWGIKEEASEGQENMIPIAKAFFKEADLKENLQIQIPSIVVGEFLMRIPPDLHITVMNLLQTSFQIPPFDLASASAFATIWQGKERLRNSLKDEISREKMKVDCQIVAIATTHTADCIFSHDKYLTKFAEGYIRVKELPKKLEQMELSFK